MRSTHNAMFQQNGFNPYCSPKTIILLYTTCNKDTTSCIQLTVAHCISKCYFIFDKSAVNYIHVVRQPMHAIHSCTVKPVIVDFRCSASSYFPTSLKYSILNKLIYTVGSRFLPVIQYTPGG